jgi:hypothetical protein
VPCNNPAVFTSTALTPSSASAGPGLTDSAYRGLISTLSSPFFYLDTANAKSNEELTFFVQPELTETLVLQRIGWAIPPIFPDLSIVDPTYWNSLVLTPQVPVRNLPIAPDVNAIFQYQSTADWLTNDSAALSFSTSVIGMVGRIDPGGVAFGGIKGTGLKIISSSGLNYAGAASLGLKTKARTVPTDRIQPT